MYSIMFWHDMNSGMFKLTNDKTGSLRIPVQKKNRDMHAIYIFHCKQISNNMFCLTHFIVYPQTGFIMVSQSSILDALLMLQILNEWIRHGVCSSGPYQMTHETSVGQGWWDEAQNQSHVQTYKQTLKVIWTFNIL